MYLPTYRFLCIYLIQQRQVGSKIPKHLTLHFTCLCLVHSCRILQFVECARRLVSLQHAVRVKIRKHTITFTLIPIAQSLHSQCVANVNVQIAVSRHHETSSSDYFVEYIHKLAQVLKKEIRFPYLILYYPQSLFPKYFGLFCTLHERIQQVWLKIARSKLEQNEKSLRSSLVRSASLRHRRVKYDRQQRPDWPTKPCCGHFARC